jgi:hypothetical protein
MFLIVRSKVSVMTLSSIKRSITRCWIIPILSCSLRPSAFAQDGVTFSNVTLKGPISVNVLRIPRNDRTLEIHSLHGDGRAIGLGTVSEQLKLIEGPKPIAAVNGDFYVREGAFAGDPRGLQIMNGELLSAPVKSSSFWLDASGDPHIALVESEFRVSLPNGWSSTFGLNARCEANQAQLYSSALGAAARGPGGREIVLALAQGDTNVPLRAGREYVMKVIAVRGATNTAIEPGTFVLMFGSALAKSAPPLQPGATVTISTATVPSLRGVKTALSGGPTLVIGGKRQRFDGSGSESFQYTSMLEKHPRSALGWNQQMYFWVEVDGRQKDSVGMTLSELAAYMIELGCEEAMNLDGGGSATIWFDGSVRNKPCDGSERPVANSLALVRKPVARK